VRAGRRAAGQPGSNGGSRRVFLVWVALGLLTAYPARLPAQALDSLPDGGASGKLWDPSRAGRPLPATTARDNTDAIQVIEKRLRCTCGCQLDVYTCRTTDFTCETSPAMHQRVLSLEDAGKTGPEIVDAFVRDNGVSILMAPPKHGFNLAGYFMPAALILAAAVILVLVLRRWTRAAVPATSIARSVPASPEELERLNRALRQEPD
jgi:cytochrome c-type biogenesis protein CcmH/NrfF